jgi:hypothetical protein
MEFLKLNILLFIIEEGEATNGLDPNDMRSIYMAMRMQALDNYQLMMLPP